MNKEEAGKIAQENFKKGFNCAQSVFLVFAESLGLERETALKISQGFGGGMGRMREVCGCVSGIIMTISMLKGSSDPEDKETKDECYKIIQRLSEKFREKNGSIVCRELLGLVPLGQSENALKNKEAIVHKVEDSVSSPRTEEYYRKRPCELLCRDAAELIAEYIGETK